MTALHVDPFAVEEDSPPRDRWSRPLLVPVGGGERVPYTRMSTLAGYICDNSGLAVWQRQKLAFGLARRPDLVALIAALPALNDDECDKDSLTKDEIRQDKATKKLLNDYIEQALEAGGAHYKANHGSAVHAFIEQGGSDLTPDRMRPDVDSFMSYVGSGKVEILASEVFVVNEELGCAGRFDHIARVAGPGMSNPCVVDVKTGGVKGKGLQFAVQLSGYATSKVYDLDTDERRPLESLTGGERVSQTYGVIAHVPLGGARTDFYKVDLIRGIHCARLATNVRKARQLDGLAHPLTLETA